MKKILLIVTALLSTSFNAYSSDGWTNLFDGKTLDGWHQVSGSAIYSVENGAIVGKNIEKFKGSFLATTEKYDDFIMEFESKVDSPLNSGVQFRSLTNKDYKNGDVYGYQIEIDPTERAWTGGIFDQSRSNWMYPLSENEKARKAYKADQWNHYRIEAVGTSIRTWVNGVPASNLVDNQSLSGIFALQVHGVWGDSSKLSKKVRWKNIRIKTNNLEASRWYVGDAIKEVNFIPNYLTPRQKAEGWKLLWDGKTTNGWHGAKSSKFPAKGWEISEGVLSVLSSGGAESRHGGDIVSSESFADFELEVDFKITKGANSGIKYFVDPTLLKGEGSAIGLEFQILDDQAHPDAKNGTAGNRTLGSLYDLITSSNLTEPNRTKIRFFGVGKWNRARIVVNGGHVEHWLNGVKIVEFDRFSQMFKALVSYSKYAKWDQFGTWKRGPILLQDHGDLVHYRSIKIKTLEQKRGAGK